jgi:hypothetical protein
VNRLITSIQVANAVSTTHLAGSRERAALVEAMKTASRINRQEPRREFNHPKIDGSRLEIAATTKTIWITMTVTATGGRPAEK